MKKIDIIVNDISEKIIVSVPYSSGVIKVGDLVKSNNVANSIGIGIIIETLPNYPHYVIHWLEKGITTKYLTPADLEKYV